MSRGPRLFCSLVVLALTVACRSGPPPAGEGPPVDLEVVAASRLNPDDRGQSLPTVVRVYQLRAAGRLDRAEFDRLCREPKEALQDDLLRVDELTLTPGATVNRRLDREQGARYLAVVALFRRPTGTSWRAIAELGPPGKGQKLSFAAEGYRVERR